MPIYDYKCQYCDNEEKNMILPIDHGIQYCDKCEMPMNQQLSPPHITFKGQGWTPNSGIVRRK